MLYSISMRRTNFNFLVDLNKELIKQTDFTKVNLMVHLSSYMSNIIVYHG